MRMPWTPLVHWSDATREVMTSDVAFQIRRGVVTFWEGMAEGPWPLPLQTSSAPATIADPEDVGDSFGM